MREATINIEVTEVEDGILCETYYHKSDLCLIMIGLTNAIKELETKVPEDLRGQFRADILKLLNDRH